MPPGVSETAAPVAAGPAVGADAEGCLPGVKMVVTTIRTAIIAIPVLAPTSSRGLDRTAATTAAIPESAGRGGGVGLPDDNPEAPGCRRSPTGTVGAESVGGSPAGTGGMVCGSGSPTAVPRCG